MKNKAVIAIVVILVLLIGGYGTYRIVKHFNRLAGAPVTTTTQGPVAKTLADLIGLGSAQKCTFDQGTVYIGTNKKVRGDFSNTTGGQTTNSHMIVDGTTSYIWMEGSTTGFKMTFNATPAPNATPGTAVQGGFDTTKPANYNCSGWTEDNTLFTLPKGVKFTDFSSLMPSSVPVPTSIPNIPSGY